MQVFLRHSQCSSDETFSYEFGIFRGYSCVYVGFCADAMFIFTTH